MVLVLNKWGQISIIFFFRTDACPRERKEPQIWICLSGGGLISGYYFGCMFHRDLLV